MKTFKVNTIKSMNLKDDKPKAKGYVRGQSCI